MSSHSSEFIKRTLVNDALELLANGQQLDARPEIRPNGLWHAERPAAAVDVAAVLPDRLETLLEKVDGFTHLYLGYGGVVVVAPEFLDRLDRFSDLFEGCRVVFTSCRRCILLLPMVDLLVMNLNKILKSKPSANLPIEIDIPVMLDWQRSHSFQHVLLCIISLFCW